MKKGAVTRPARGYAPFMDRGTGVKSQHTHETVEFALARDARRKANKIAKRSKVKNRQRRK